MHLYFSLLIAFILIVTACSTKEVIQTDINPPQSEAAQLPTKDEIYRHAQQMSQYPRKHIGTADWEKGMNYVFQQFKALGLQDVTKENFATPVWDVQSWSLNVLDGNNSVNIPCSFEYNAGFTNAAGVTAPLLYIGSSLESASEKVEGKIVVADLNFLVQNGQPNPFVRPNHLGLPKDNGTSSLLDLYWRCANRGAVGMVFILANSPTNNPEYMWPNMDANAWPIPSVFVGKNAKAQLENFADSGKSAKLVLTGSRNANGQAYNLVGTLPGQSDSVVLVVTHGDSPFSGAVEDGTGVASVLAQARAWSKMPAKDRPYTLVFVVTAAHFFDNDIGSRKFAEKHLNDYLNKTKLLLVIEHVAGKAVEFKNNQAVATDKLSPWVIYHSKGKVLPEVQNLVRTYAPVQEISLSDGAALSAASGFQAVKKDLDYVSIVGIPWYLVFSEDTIDKVDKDALYNANLSILKFTKAYLD